QPIRWIATDLSGNGRVNAPNHAAELHTAPDKPWRVIGILGRIGHQRPHTWRYDRLPKHAPAGIGDEFGAERLDGCDITSLGRSIVHVSTTGHNHSDLWRFGSFVNQSGKSTAFVEREMRIAKADEPNPPVGRCVELLPPALQFRPTDAHPT